jgi:CBS-domain-containing membrane protein
MKVTNLMRKTVSTCRPEDSLWEAAGLMLKHDCGALPVVDEEQVVLGMITDRDICMCSLMEGGALDCLPVSRAMSREVWGLRPADSYSDACTAMKTHGVRRLPVMDEKHQLLGILGLGDLAGVVAGKKKGAAQAELVTALVELTSEPVPAEAPRVAAKPVQV